MGAAETTELDEEVVRAVPVAEEAPVAFALSKSLPGGDISTWSSGRAIVFTYTQTLDVKAFFDNVTIEPSVDVKFSGDILH